MDLVKRFEASKEVILTVDMHTVGEPTRIVYKGFPLLDGTLLEQRSEAQLDRCDRIRRRLMLEPRGHRDMYGAILRPMTEHTKTGKAHMGVLFTTNAGYSTMCGHATIALGRFLIDTHDLSVFPQRDRIECDPASKTARLLLHAPCGIVDVTVPTNDDGTESDPSRPVSHISVPSFATGVDVRIEIPLPLRWPELDDRDYIVADFSYGGAFYCFITASELGFKKGLDGTVDLQAMDQATKNLKTAVNKNAQYRYLFSHPEHEELGFLYSVIVVDKTVGAKIPGTDRAETGLCFFADQQIDRSPTGSGVAARVALAFAKEPTTTRQAIITYHSLLSKSLGGQHGFAGRLHEELGQENGFPIVRVQVDGYASYTGASSFVVEDNDPLKDDGFLFERLS